jgi:hypothetical protein
MIYRDDPAHLLGRDHESVVAMLADASVRGDRLQLAETRSLFELVSRRSAAILPPASARFTATLILGPVAALAVTVDDIDAALAVAYSWLSERPTCVLRGLGHALAPLDRMVDDLRSMPTVMDEGDQAEIGARWEERFLEASVLIPVGRTACRIVACADELQIRVQDPETGVYLTFGHLPFDPDEDRQDAGPEPQLAA